MVSDHIIQFTDTNSMTEGETLGTRLTLIRTIPDY
jgi:hypothetical protein